MNPRVGVLRLGCARNDVDADELEARLAAEGIPLSEDGDDVDVLLVNSCGFVASAKKDSIDAILAAADTGARVVVTGCLAERYGHELADSLPLVWGGSVLASRASRRIAEALRRACGRPALAADAGEIETLLRATPSRDPFADPFETADDVRPALLLLDDDLLPDHLRGVADRLRRLAESAGLRVSSISSGDDEFEAGDVVRYVTLLQKGLYGAAYLEIGLAD